MPISMLHGRFYDHNPLPTFIFDIYKPNYQNTMDDDFDFLSDFIINSNPGPLHSL